MSLLQHFARQLHSHGLSANHRVAIAVSGGSDSLALALLTAWWQGQGGVPSRLAVVNVPAGHAAPACLAHRPPGDLVSAARRLLLQQAAVAPVPAAPLGARHRPQGPQLAGGSVAVTPSGANGANAGHPPSGAAFALIIDHALRPESRAEAAQTAELVAGWGLRPVLLTAEWPGGRPPHGELMAAARLERQRLFRRACLQHGVNNLLVAHQADDQAETFLMRLSRASGVDGLAGMASASPLIAADDGSCACGDSSTDSCSDTGDIRVLRPLLGVWRSQLRALLRRCGVAWVDDPTNSDTSYSRNAIRALLTEHDSGRRLAGGLGGSGLGWSMPPAMPGSPVTRDGGNVQRRTLAGAGLSAADNPSNAEAAGAADLSALAAAASGQASVVEDLLWLQRRCAAAHTDMQGAAAALLAACTPQTPPAPSHVPGTIVLAVPPLTAAPQAALVRVLSSVLQAVSGGPVTPKLDSVLRLARLITTGALRSQRFSGAGCLVRPVAGSRGRLVRFERQPQQQRQRQR